MKPKIAVIDSGIGGLTLFSKLIHYGNIAYIADNKYFPYGIKKDSELINIVDRLIFYFLNRNYDKVILACNTASYIYLKYLRYKYKDSVISILEKTVNDLDNYKGIKHVGILATNKVVESRIYESLLKSKYQVKVTSLACSKLVYLIENNDKNVIKAYLHKKLSAFNKNIDVIILACTHFNLVENVIASIYKKQIPVICSGYSLIEEYRNNLLCSMCCDNVIYITNYYEDYIMKIKSLFNNLKNTKFKSLNL